MQPVEDGSEEVCIIDTILEEQGNQQRKKDLLTEELAECSEGQQEAQDMKIVQGQWRKKEEIIPLLIKEGTSEPQKLELKPLPVELNYTYLEEQEQCPVINSSLLSTLQEGSLLHILRENKQALGWKITNLKGISSEVCTHHIYLEEEAKSIRQP